MITEVLDFVARKSLEVMIAEKEDQVIVQLTPNTFENVIALKIETTPYAKKVAHIGEQLSKQNLEHLMDVPLNFLVKSDVTPNSAAYDEVWENSGTIQLEITPETDNAEQFLAGFAKQQPIVQVPIKDIPRFENPEM